ncbi:MAG TPA: hypothetical protein VG871_09750 [Vicinamibacterales bacterium]|nr:hypothetical protein [Vicinamibacterales bacterium]
MAGAREIPQPKAFPRALVIAAALFFVACGKKGPPLPPYSHFPAAVANPVITRLGNTMYVSVTIPAKNIDGSLPPDVAHVEVYGVTALRPPNAAQMLQIGRVVATVAVAPSPAKGEPIVVTDKPLPGGKISIVDTLRPDDLTPAALPVPGVRGRGAGARGTATPIVPVTPSGDEEEAPLPQRFYMAIAFNDRGRPGPPGAINGLPLRPLPDPPILLAATYTADTLTLTWMPPASASQPGPAVPPSLVTRYNVYAVTDPDPLVLPPPAAPAWAMLPPMPANPSPLAAPPFTMPPAFGRQTCFTVRTVRGTAPAVEGEPSGRFCRTPIDTFPPAAPKSLSAVPAQNAISLIWEPNTEPDLGGYVVLRGEAGSATLQPLTATPIAEPQFTDRTVQSGVRYVYAVEAVDTRVPVPNASAESNRVEETAR